MEVSLADVGEVNYDEIIDKVSDTHLVSILMVTK